MEDKKLCWNYICDWVCRIQAWCGQWQKAVSENYDKACQE